MNEFQQLIVLPVDPPGGGEDVLCKSYYTPVKIIQCSQYNTPCTLRFNRGLPYSAKFSRNCNFLNFVETIFTDAVNVMPNVHNHTKNFAHKIFEVGDHSSKNTRKFGASKIWRYSIYYGMSGAILKEHNNSSAIRIQISLIY